MARNPNINYDLGVQPTQVATPQNTVTTQSSATQFDPAALQGLQKLIAMLAQGGTNAQQADRDSRTQAAQGATQARDGYSKEAGFADAQAAMAAQMREALAKVMPTIIRSAEGSGTSQNSMRALLTQKAAGQAADQSATLGMKAAVDYGQLYNALTQSLQGLTTGTDPVQAALLQAFSTLKGANVSETKNVSSPQGQAAPAPSYGGLGSGPSSSGLGSVLRDPFAGTGMSVVGNVQSYTGGLANPGSGGDAPNSALSSALRSMTF